MAINKSSPTPFTPRGLVDAFDATEKFSGACRQLSNLIFDQSNPEVVLNRPGVIQLTAFSPTFTNPTFISIQAAVGTRIYGMVATSRNAGHDEPFCYDFVAGAFITISNVLAGNTPTSPSTVGDWTPPTLDVVGTMVIITHPGFNGVGSNFYGIIDITNPAAPAWRSENTTTNPLTGVPTCVANLNNRAYFAVGNQLQYTDVLTNPLTRTAATQALVIGDSQPVNTLRGLPLQTTSSGVVAALTIFKQTQIWQVAGDTSTANLSQDYMSLNIGTISPRSVVQAPYGMYFVASGGPYFLDLLGAVRQITHGQQDEAPDILAPFQNAITPTRWSGAYTAGVYRVCGPTVILGVQSTNDYWFDEHKRRWTGPHSFPYDCACALGEVFILSSALNPGILIQANPIPSTTYPVTDLGVPITFTLQSSAFPKKDPMSVKQVAESQIELVAPTGPVTFSITAQNQRGQTIGAVNITAGGTPVPLWGAPGLTWGMPGLFWTSSSQPFIPLVFPIPWTAPLVFEKIQLLITGAITSPLGIGAFFARYQLTGYMTTGIE